MSFSARRLSLAAAIALLFALCAAAIEPRAGTLVLDPSRTVIDFRLPGALHTTHGSFKLERGTITADPSTGKADGTIVVDAASGDSGLDARDGRMDYAVLEAPKYPEITFAPHHIDGRLESSGDFHAVMDGVMKIHGGEHRMTIEVDGHLSGDDVSATCRFSVPYVEWGMEDPSLPLLSVSSSVDIDVATAGHVMWAAPSAAATPLASR